MSFSINYLTTLSKNNTIPQTTGFTTLTPDYYWNLPMRTTDPQWAPRASHLALCISKLVTKVATFSAMFDVALEYSISINTK